MAGQAAASRPAFNQAAASRAAIARAAQATGVDFDYLLAQAKLESGLDPDARASTSSATGLYQFVGGTWLDTLKKHGAEHGLGWASAAAGDPARRAQVMALRRDPQASALMAAELAGDNRAALVGALGREPDPAELYLAHFLGPQGAAQFLAALSADPDRSAASLLPAAAGANRAIFFAADGAPRSLGAVMGLLRGKLGAAMEGGSADQWASQWTDAAPVAAAYPGGPLAQAFHAAAGSAAGSGAGSGGKAAAPMQSSMADTLKQTFGLDGATGLNGANGLNGGAVPQHVRSAYGRLAALGL